MGEDFAVSDISVGSVVEGFVQPQDTDALYAFKSRGFSGEIRVATSDNCRGVGEIAC